MECAMSSCHHTYWIRQWHDIHILWNREKRKKTEKNERKQKKTKTRKTIEREIYIYIYQVEEKNCRAPSRRRYGRHLKAWKKRAENKKNVRWWYECEEHTHSALKTLCNNSSRLFNIHAEFCTSQRSQHSAVTGEAPHNQWPVVRTDQAPDMFHKSPSLSKRSSATASSSKSPISQHVLWWSPDAYYCIHIFSSSISHN